MANSDSSFVSSAPAPSPISRREYWQGVIEECHRSGLRQAEFCRQRGIKRRSLSFWKWKLSHGPGTDAPVASGRRRPLQPRAFVPVRVVPPQPPGGDATNEGARAWDGEIELVLAPGRLVRVRGRVDAEWLRQVMVMVESTRC
jgi:hypothetical protein